MRSIFPGLLACCIVGCGASSGDSSEDQPPASEWSQAKVSVPQTSHDSNAQATASPGASGKSTDRTPSDMEKSSAPGPAPAQNRISQARDRMGNTVTRMEVEAPGAEELSPEKLAEQNRLLSSMIAAANRRDYLRALTIGEQAMKNRPKDMLLAFTVSNYNFFHASSLRSGGVLAGDADKYFLRAAELSRVQKISGAKLIPQQVHAMRATFWQEACVLASQQKYPDAVKSLEDANEAGFGDVELMRREQRLAGLRGTQEFQDFLQTAKLSPGYAGDKNVAYVAGAHILIRYAGQQGAPAGLKRTRDEALAKIKEIYRRANQVGVDFAAIAAEVSEADDASDGGEIEPMPSSGPPVADRIMSPAILRQCRMGVVTTPIESPYGFHIILRKPAYIGISLVRIAFKGAKETPPGISRTEEEAKLLADQCLARINKGEDIAIIATEVSDDVSGKIGGALGHVWRHQLEPAFRKYVSKLKVDETTDVFRAPTGYYIVNRYE